MHLFRILISEVVVHTYPYPCRQKRRREFYDVISLAEVLNVFPSGTESVRMKTPQDGFV